MSGFVTGHRGNVHKSYGTWQEAWARWLVACLTREVRGPVHESSYVGLVRSRNYRGPVSIVAALALLLPHIRIPCNILDAAAAQRAADARANAAAAAARNAAAAAAAQHAAATDAATAAASYRNTASFY